jgi:hypothetical protein
MGHIRHHAIIVTGHDQIDIIHKKAKSIFGKQVSNAIHSVMNSYSSFIVGPDGSKEGRREGGVA